MAGVDTVSYAAKDKIRTYFRIEQKRLREQKTRFTPILAHINNLSI